MARVNVYGEDGSIISRVKYNTNLDIWDGRKYGRGTGYHLGLTQLVDGRFVLISGTDWQGQHDSAEIISRSRAIQEILRANNVGLLDKYGLRAEAERLLIQEAVYE